MRDELVVGNIDVKRDFGYAPEYVKAMVLIACHEVPGDFIVCSGKAISLREIILHVFLRLGIDESRIRVDPALWRPAELQEVRGDNTKARRELSWNYSMSFRDMLDNILNESIRHD